MSNVKTATLTLRIDPVIKDALRSAAEQDRRSIANMIEVLIVDHCKKCAIEIPEQQSLFEKGKA